MSKAEQALELVRREAEADKARPITYGRIDAYDKRSPKNQVIRKPTPEEIERGHMPCRTCRALHEKYGRELFVGLFPVVHEPDLSPLTPDELGETT